MVKQCIIELNKAADAVCTYLADRKNGVPSAELTQLMARFWEANEEAKKQIRAEDIPPAQEK